MTSDRFKTVPILILLLLAGCSLEDRPNPVADSDPEPNPTGTPFTIDVGETVTVNPFGLEVTFDSVLSDSRCPLGAVCIWRGLARVRLEVASNESDRQGVIFLHDGHQPAPDTSRYVVTDAGTFRLDLTEVNPYPHVDSAYDYSRYSVRLNISAVTAEAVDGSVIPTRLGPAHLAGDPVEADSAWIEEESIHIRAVHSGGCNNHNYSLFMSPPFFAESNPVMATLYLYHNANGDACEAVITEELVFDLQPMLDIQRDLYGEVDRIRLQVYDLPNRTWRRAVEIMFEPTGAPSLPILPLAAGNHWVFADTVWYNGVPTGRLDTVEVIRSYEDTLGTWWELSGPLLTLGDTVMVRGDSIYSFQHGYMADYPAREYIPPDPDPVTYTWIYEGDMLFERIVSLSPDPVITPAGRFNDVYEYKGLFGCDAPMIQYLKPGVGFVFSAQPECQLTQSTTFSRRTWLIDYSVGN